MSPFRWINGVNTSKLSSLAQHHSVCMIFQKSVAHPLACGLNSCNKPQTVYGVSFSSMRNFAWHLSTFCWRPTKLAFSQPIGAVFCLSKSSYFLDARKYHKLTKLSSYCLGGSGPISPRNANWRPIALPTVRNNARLFGGPAPPARHDLVRLGPAGVRCAHHLSVSVTASCRRPARVGSSRSFSWQPRPPTAPARRRRGVADGYY